MTRPLASALVTGGAGFVGHAVVRALHDRGARIRVLDPGPPHPDWPLAVEHHQGSVLDPAGLRAAARGVDVIFHAAGIWDGGPGGEERMETLNVGGTARVLELGLPTVYTSSSITCGFGPWSRPGLEDEPSEDPDRPVLGAGGAYRRSKLAAEELVTGAGGFLVNPDYVVGGGDVNGVVTGPLLKASRMRVLPAPRGGKCFVGVDDVGEGHVRAWLHGRPGRRYLLGAENRRYADVLRTLAHMQGLRLRLVPIPSLVPSVLARTPGLRSRAAEVEQMNLERYRSSARARQELGWVPGPVDEALKEALNWAGRS